MKNNCNCFLLLLCCIFLWPLCFLKAQNIEVDLQRVKAKYEGVESLSVEMEAYAFSKKEPKGHLHYRGTFHKHQDRIYTNTGDHEMLIRAEKMIIVNHTEREIVIGKTQEEDNLTPAAVPFSLDSLMAHGAKVKLLHQQNGIRKYRIDFPASLLAAIELEISAADLIHRMVYHYRDNELAQAAYDRLEINYKNISFEIPAASWFDEKKYVSRHAGKTLEAAPTLKGYTVSAVDYSAYLDR